MVNIQKAQRNSSFELLRIISMLFIVLSHACCHSGLETSNMSLGLNRLFLEWGVLGDLGVDIFIMISGYFLSQKSLHINTFARLLSQVWFYSIGLFFISVFGLGYKFLFNEMLMSFMPTLFHQYWFFTAYIILLLLTPFINVLINAISQRNFTLLLTTIIVLWVVIPTFTTRQLYSNLITQFVIFYLIGAYFRKYPTNWFAVKWHRVTLTIVSFSFLFLSSLVFDILECYTPYIEGKSLYFYSRNSLLIVGCAVGLFTIFQHIKPFYNKFINTVAGCTFGVYLIHDNSILRQYLWLEWFDNKPFIYDATFILRIILCAVIVFILSTVIEYLRQKTVDKPLTNVVSALLNISVKFSKKIRGIFIKS